MKNSLTGARIVVLDDDETNVVLLHRLLLRAGYTRVETATAAAEVLDGLSDDPPDLLMLDLHMPAVDGFAVLHRLERHIRGPLPMPVLVLTADMAPGVKRRALAAGARDFLTKPYDLMEVLLRVHNLLEVRDLVRRLNDHAQQIERSDERRLTDLGALAADMAHELRTPLYAIRGMVEVMLGEGPSADGPGRDLEVIDGVAAAALEVVDRQIAQAQQATGRTPMTPGPVRLPELMQRLQQMLKPLADARRIALVIDDTSALPHLHTDAVVLAQVLRNLLSNAIRHTPSGEVRLRTELRRSDTVAFVVQDTGVGVHVDDRERIFEPFLRVGADAEDTGGIGLPLARRLARMLGGDVTLEEPTGSGSTFTALIATGTPEEGVPFIA